MSPFSPAGTRSPSLIGCGRWPASVLYIIGTLCKFIRSEKGSRVSVWMSQQPFSSHHVLERFPEASSAFSLRADASLPPSFFFKNVFTFYWRIIALQYCVGFCQTSTWSSPSSFLLPPPPRSSPFSFLPSFFLPPSSLSSFFLSKFMHSFLCCLLTVHLSSIRLCAREILCLQGHWRMCFSPRQTQFLA